MFFFFLNYFNEFRSLKDLASITAGISATRLPPGAGDGAAVLPVISLSDVDKEVRAREELTTVSTLLPAADRFRVRVNDVVVTTRGSDIRAAVITESHDGAIAGANLAIVRLKGSLLPGLLVVFLRRPQTQEALLRTTAGASTPGFPLTTLEELQIRVPSKERQEVMAQMIEATQGYREAMTRAVQLRVNAWNETITQELTP
jgi:hypothetical protein